MNELGRNGTGTHRVFWADAVADEIQDRNPDDPIIIKGGVSPSGVPHLGHFNEIMRGYFVAESLRNRGYEVRQVFTTDDRDRLRTLPRALADLEWNIVGLGDIDAGALGQNLGKPYTDVPDPFGCCDSYGDHFTELLKQAAEAVDVPIDIVSNTDLYTTGEFDAAIRHVLQQPDRARSVLSEFQEKVDGSYIPFFAKCANCGNLTETITAVDIDAETVEYICEDVQAGEGVIEGCGHTGTATFREGKLPWRFEWPAQWLTLGVDFEPFGKDHAEGSWPSGKRIAHEVFEFDPPVPMVYEWFTVDGEALSSSTGNIVTVDEVLKYLEVEVLRFFFTKNPNKQRDFSIETLDRLVDEFDAYEDVYYEGEGENEIDRQRAERVYPMVVTDTPSETQPIRIPYTFAAVLGMTDNRDLQIQMAHRSGHLPADAAKSKIEIALQRVDKARAWAVQTDNEFNYRLAVSLPEVDFDPAVSAALDELAAVVETEQPDSDTLQEAIYEIASAREIDVGEFFQAGYRLFLDEAQGPRLGPFLAALDREFVIRRLRREE